MNQKLSTTFKLFFDNSNHSLIEKFEKENDLIFSDEYKHILNRYSYKDEFAINFKIETPNLEKKYHYFGFTNFYSLEEMESDFNLFKDNESECKMWFNGFTSYNANGYVPILSMIGNSDFRELFLNCSQEENGSLFLIDRGIIYGLNENGEPVKIKIADSISHLVEIIESQIGQIPEEYLIK